MRVKWSRDLDVPAARRDPPEAAGGHRKRRGLLRIFSFLDRKGGGRNGDDAEEEEEEEEESSPSGSADSARGPPDGRKSPPEAADEGKKRRRRPTLFRRRSSRKIGSEGKTVLDDSQAKREEDERKEEAGPHSLSLPRSAETRRSDRGVPPKDEPSVLPVPPASEGDRSKGLPSSSGVEAERRSEDPTVPLPADGEALRRTAGPEPERVGGAGRELVSNGCGEEEILRRSFLFRGGLPPVGRRGIGDLSRPPGSGGWSPTLRKREEEGPERETVRIPPWDDWTASGPKLVKQPLSSYSSRTNAQINKQQQQQQQQQQPVWTTRVELAKEIRRLGTLCESRTKELTRLKMQLRHASLGFDAVAVLFRYLTEELDPFSQTRLVSELEKTKESLGRAEEHLQQYKNEFEELKMKHSSEFSELANKLNKTYQEVVEELTLKHTAEIRELKNIHEQQLAEMSEAHMKQYQEAKEKHTMSLIDLESNHQRQIEDMKRFHAEELEEIEYNHQQTRILLSNQLKELEQQCKGLKHQAKLVEEALQRDTDTKIQWISAKKADLEKEVDSLKTVLDMKRNEIHALRKENLEMKKELEKLPVAKEKIKMLQAKAEDLQALVNEKVQKERQLSCDHESLKESFEKESKVNKRLSMENEELLWKLKQTAEANFLNSLSSSPEVFEKLFSPLKSPSKQSVSLPPMFFHSIDESSGNSKETISQNVSNSKSACKKPPLSPRKCSSPVRTPSFVAATPAAPCSRRCKAEAKSSPRKQKQKSQNADKNRTPKDDQISDSINSDESVTCAKSMLDKNTNDSSVIQNGIHNVVKEECTTCTEATAHCCDQLTLQTSEERPNYKLLDFKDFVESDEQEKPRAFSYELENPTLSGNGPFPLNYCQHTICSFSEEESSNDSNSKDFLFDDHHPGEREQSDFSCSLIQREGWSLSLPRNLAGEAMVNNLSRVVNDESLQLYAFGGQKARNVHSQKEEHDHECSVDVSDSNNLDTSCEDFLSESEKTS